MAVVVFLRGVNVGGHRTLRPTALAARLAAYDAVNVGAAGTLVIRKPPRQAELRAALARALPFEAQITLCAARALADLAARDPFAGLTDPPEVVRFVSILARSPRRVPPLPLIAPPGRDWLLRILGVERRLVYGVYRRHMKVIAHLDAIDALFGVPATTRSWTTIAAVLRAAT